MTSAIDLEALPQQFKQAIQAIRSVVPAELASPKWGIIWYAQPPFPPHTPLSSFFFFFERALLSLTNISLYLSDAWCVKQRIGSLRPSLFPHQPHPRTLLFHPRILRINRSRPQILARLWPPLQHSRRCMSGTIPHLRRSLFCNLRISYTSYETSRRRIPHRHQRCRWSPR